MENLKQEEMNKNVALRVSFAIATLLSIEVNGVPVNYGRRQVIDSVFGNYSSDKLVKCFFSSKLKVSQCHKEFQILLLLSCT